MLIRVVRQGWSDKYIDVPTENPDTARRVAFATVASRPNKDWQELAESTVVIKDVMKLTERETHLIGSLSR